MERYFIRIMIDDKRFIERKAYMYTLEIQIMVSETKIA